MFHSVPHLLVLDGLQALEGLHACSGSTRDVSRLLMNKAGPAKCPLGSTRPGFCLSTLRALGPCMLVRCEIKEKLSPQLFICTPGPSRILAKAFFKNVNHGSPPPWSSRWSGSGEKAKQQTRQGTRNHPLFPHDQVLITGSCWFCPSASSLGERFPSSLLSAHANVARPVNPSLALNRVLRFKRNYSSSFLKLPQEAMQLDCSHRCKQFSSQYKVLMRSLAHACLVIIG